MKKKLPKRDSKGRFVTSSRKRDAPTANQKRTTHPRSQGKLSQAAKQAANKKNKEAEKKGYRKTVDVTARDSKGSREDVEKVYDKTIIEGFDNREIKIINKTGGVDLCIRKPKGTNEAAVYEGKKNGKHRISVKNSHAKEKETLTHETIHILQETDPERDEVDRWLSKRDAKGEIILSREERRIKEALTEAETIARVVEPGQYSGYYSDLDGDAHKQKDEDRKRIKGDENKSLKGESPKVVYKLFDRLNIRKTIWKKDSEPEKNPKKKMKSKNRR
jgi:hypothetical protein